MYCKIIFLMFGWLSQANIQVKTVIKYLESVHVAVNVNKRETKQNIGMSLTNNKSPPLPALLTFQFLNASCNSLLYVGMDTPS